MSKEEKQKLKEEKLQLEEKYGFCYLDGRKQKVGNFRIEPPGLFRGRGKHPKTGSLKVIIYIIVITFFHFHFNYDCIMKKKFFIK
jgi:DNA topoisomerase IB